MNTSLFVHDRVEGDLHGGGTDMPGENIPPTSSGTRSSRLSGWLGLFLVLGIGILLWVVRKGSNTADQDIANRESKSMAGAQSRHENGSQTAEPQSGAGIKLTAEQIVAAKVAQFTGLRRDYVRQLAIRKGVKVPAEVERFFDALQAGEWTEIETQWKALAARSGQYAGGGEIDQKLSLLWPGINDAYGAARQAHLWPAQPLLDYGNAVLDSLRPGMVYLGGTDEGRWIPELLNETSGKDPHVIISQHSIANSEYLEFIRDLHGERLVMLASEDIRRGFQEYTQEAVRRLAHDRNSPDEPHQMRPMKTGR